MRDWGRYRGGEPVCFAKKTLYQKRRQESRFRVSDPEPGTWRGSFLMPENGTCTPARQILMSVLDPEPWWWVLDIDREMGGVFGSVGKTLVLYAHM